MNSDVIIADSIRYQPAQYAFDMWMQQTFKRQDVSAILMYFIDTVDARALPILAQEFDVLGIKGWDFATTEAQQRQLIKNAIQLHRYKGTPWAIKQVVAQAGYVNATLQEGTGTDPVTGWAVFRITIDLATNTIDATQISTAVALVNEYKNERSQFEGLFFVGLDFSDDFAATDSFSVEDGDFFNDNMNTQGKFLYDGSVLYNGSHNYNQDLDTIVINII